MTESSYLRVVGERSDLWWSGRGGPPVAKLHLPPGSAYVNPEPTITLTHGRTSIQSISVLYRRDVRRVRIIIITPSTLIAVASRSKRWMSPGCSNQHCQADLIVLLSFTLRRSKTLWSSLVSVWDPALVKEMPARSVGPMKWLGIIVDCRGDYGLALAELGRAWHLIASDFVDSF